MDKKGNEFKGLAGGANYKRFAALIGMNEEYYRRCIGNLKLAAGMKALDLGCGPGALSYALAEKADPDSEIIGIDISEDQLNYARSRIDDFKCCLEFKNISMDELLFPDEYFDVVITSMALHVTPPKIRRAAIAETARVLKSGGLFLLVDWSKPKFGLQGIFWFPMLRWGQNNKDNWNNVYPQLCDKQNLVLTEDTYINSVARKQVFEKRIIQ
ncbi:MAG: class I SAM-dependent methyltransferase [Ignavibacteria bacterium]|jgi:ubiquinone/menaquinone biosynthesis C-methylase UbiE